MLLFSFAIAEVRGPVFAGNGANLRGAAVSAAARTVDSKALLGTPIVTYWAGPAMTDAAAGQMAEGGFNVVWCTEKELDVAHRHGLRAQLQDGLLRPQRSTARPCGINSML